MAEYWCMQMGPGWTHHGEHVWIQDDGKEYFIPFEVNPSRYQRATGDPSVDLAPTFKSPCCEKARLALGEYHPRIWRPGDWPRGETQCPREFSLTINSARNLFVGMREVFRYVEPSPTTLSAYGHEIRNLLILAATEVESGLKQVLEANGYEASSGRPPKEWTTNDYVKLLEAMRLDEYELALFAHPDCPSFRPFAGWSVAAPTKSLDWYAAYHTVKHNRETLFDQATLGRMLHAMGAVFVLVLAQFGAFGTEGTDLVTPWEFDGEQPDWPLCDWYVPPSIVPGARWVARPLF